MHRLVMKARNRVDAERFTKERLGEVKIYSAHPTNGYEVTRQWVVVVDKANPKTVEQWHEARPRRRGGAPFPDSTLIWYEKV